MKKNFIFSLFTLATMLFTASCSEQELVDPSLLNGDVVTFTVNLQQSASTRADAELAGRGTLANELYYGVYEKTSNNGWALIPAISALTRDYTYGDENHPAPATITYGSPTQVKIKLAKQKEYSVIFWAANAENNMCNVDWTARTMTVTGGTANNEKNDVFWAYDEVEVNAAVAKTVDLYRPFAQLNIGASIQDIEDAADAEMVVEKSQIVLEKVANTFNMETGEASGDTTLTYSSAYILNADNWKFPVDDHEYIALGYVLANTNDKSLVDVELTYTDTKDNDYNSSFTSVPVQRNYRTNIYGNLLSNSADYNVNVQPEFGGNVIDGETIFDIPGLQAAIDAAPAGEQPTTIYLGADLEGDVTIVQKPGVKITVDGAGKSYNGSIKVHSNSNHYADAALTVKNVNFTTSVASTNFIEALENGSKRYSTNITVENCTFTATDEAVNTAVGVQIKASKNAQVLNCTATDMHSLVQAQSCDETVKVIGCTIEGKNGVAFKQVKAATVEGTTITATGYGIRFDGNIDNYGITVNNNTVTAVQPFIVRKMTGANNTITLEGTNTLTTESKYQIVITNGSDDAEYVKPTGTYTLSGADNYLVYPRDFLVASWDEFTAALAANEPKIKLTGDITYDANYQLQKDVVIDLNGKSMTLPMVNIHTKTTIKNGTINGKVYARKNSEIVFNNVKFSGAVADNLSTEGHLAIQGGCKSLYAKDCLFSPTSVSGSQTKPLSFEGGSTIMKFENCEFKSSPYKKQVYFNSLSATGSLDFTNCNFNNKTPNIMFAAACPLTNLTMSGTTKLSSVTLETNRAKDAVTAEDLAYLRESLIANNSMSSVRLFYAGGSSEYIR